MAITNEKEQGLFSRMMPAGLVGLGHGATHWVAAVFLFCLPFLSEETGIGIVEAGFLASVFHIASFLANLGSGPVVDMTGRRVLWQVVSLTIGAAGLVVFAFSPALWLAVLAVSAIGASNNLWHPAAISYLSQRYPGRRGLALSIHALGANLGDAVAPLVLGLVIAVFGWRESASISVIVPVLTALALLFFLKRTSAGGAVSASEGKAGKADFLAGLKSLVGNRAVLAMCLMSGFRNLAQAGLLVFLPFYLLREIGFSVWAAGAAMFAFQICGMVAAPVAGHLSDRIGRRPVVMAGLSLSTLVLAGLSFVESGPVFVAGISVLGFALFAIRPVVHSWLMDIAPSHMGGSATSLMFGVQSLLAMIAPVAGGWLADQYGLIAAFYFLGAGMLVANAMVFALPKQDSVKG
ncbi:MFS transporter [Aestuariispira insulae]|uniref:Sugar phosphate permease n=1 Tax=Aestuariispira insulae TaxID=1461337 RepID=A0A3D9HXG8_9PROT|nr:MFS transporter [Aestuariispira insulae]RED54202.1 sugar phosphate permease [Aestuariispira insulae]